jgi:hypothetical protein
MSETPKIRPLKKSDLGEFNSMGKTVRGYAVELDGKVIGIAGVLHTRPLQAFSRMEDELRKHPKTIIEVINTFKDILKNYDMPVYAIASEKEYNSTKVLERIGFELMNDRKYVWIP